MRSEVPAMIWKNVVYGLGGRDCATEDIRRVFDRLMKMVETGQRGPVYNHMGQRDLREPTV